MKKGDAQDRTPPATKNMKKVYMLLYPPFTYFRNSSFSRLRRSVS